MTGISQLPHCYGNTVAMATKSETQYNYFDFNCIELLFGMEVLWHHRHQPTTLLL